MKPQMTSVCSVCYWIFFKNTEVITQVESNKRSTPALNLVEILNNGAT